MEVAVFAGPAGVWPGAIGAAVPARGRSARESGGSLSALTTARMQVRMARGNAGQELIKRVNSGKSCRKCAKLSAKFFGASSHLKSNPCRIRAALLSCCRLYHGHNSRPHRFRQVRPCLDYDSQFGRCVGQKRHTIRHATNSSVGNLLLGLLLCNFGGSLENCCTPTGRQTDEHLGTGLWSTAGAAE